jgi:hypothetical protein
MNRLLTTLLTLVLAGATLPTMGTASPSSTQPPAMKNFVLLFRQGPHPLTDADKARRQAAISAWAREQNAAGHKLEPRSLAADATRPGLVAAPETHGAWPVTALVFLEAADLAEATRIAEAHPAKDYNVSVEVRPWSAPAVSLATVRAADLFDVKMTPAGENRFTLEKQYRGDLAAAATGEMLTAMTATKGSAGYVAIEKVTGQLAGRSGSFQLQHTGTMNRGVPSLTITVVPDSGTDGLAGLTGTMRITIAADGTHSYEFDYALPEK